MSEELQNDTTNSLPDEDIAQNHLSKELQKLLSQSPELQGWRDAIVTEQTVTGKQAGQKYSSLSTPERLSQFFVSRPHTTTGWMIRALSPENALLHIDTHSLETEQRPHVVIDPFRIGNLGKQHGSFSLREVKSKDDMAQMISAVREWLLNAQPILSGRVILGTDGRIGRFQEVKKGRQGRESRKNPKLVPSNRAYLTMLPDIHHLLDSQQYARNHLEHGKRTIEDITDDVAQLIANCVEKKPVRPEFAETKTLVKELVENIRSRIQVRGSFFYLDKLMIDYLCRLNGGQHDGTLVYWAAKILEDGLKNRIGKSAGIQEQVILLELGKNVELYHWKHCICGATRGKVDIAQVLEDISSDFPAFKERVKTYIPLKDAPVFNPFFSFYHEWQDFIAKNPKNPLEAQQRIAQQYILITLQEIKTRYAYRNTIPEADQRVLQSRIAILNQLRERFFPSLPEISLDFGAEKTILNETLKKTISHIHNFFSQGSPSNSAIPPETGTPS